MKYLEWEVPASGTISDPIISNCTPETAIKIMREAHPQAKLTDEQALLDFKIVFGAWEKEYD